MTIGLQVKEAKKFPALFHAVQILVSPSNIGIVILDRLSSCEVNHIRRVDTEEDQHDFCRFYPRSYLSQSVMFLLSAK